MFPFELSITNLIIIAAVAFLAVFYVFFLLKLKPSTEKSDKPKKYALPRKQEPPKSRPTFVGSAKTEETTVVPQRAQNQLNLQKMQPPPTKTTSLPASQDKRQKPPEHVVISEPRSSNLHCVHHFGYLTELPRNTAIPTECLGCSKAVECMTTLKLEEKQVKSSVTKS